MAVTSDPAVYKEIVVVLAAAGVVIPLFRKLGVSSVIGFLFTGLLLGPGVLGQFVPQHPWLEYVTLPQGGGARSLAELGVVFLLFMTGIELSFNRLVTMRRLVFGFGGLQVLVSALVLAGALALAGATAVEAALIGVALALSSTAIVIQLLSDDRRMASHTGRTSFAVLLFQDLAVIPIMLMIGILGASTQSSLLQGVILALVQTLLAVAAIIVAGRFLLRPLLRLVANARSPEFFLAATLLIAVGAGLIANLAGVSMAMGAFVAGLLLAESEYRREIESIIDPFKGLLLGAFFLQVGADIDIGLAAGAPLAVAGALIGFILIKALVTFGLGLAFRIRRASLAESALLLAPGGEFAFVVLGTAMTLGILGKPAGDAALVVVSLSMAALPLLARLGRHTSRQLTARAGLSPEAAAPPPDDDQPRVLIVGFGRVGNLIADMLDEQKIAYLAIESTPDIVSAARKAGKPVYYGDASRPEFLRRCGIAGARAIAITMDAPKKVEEVTVCARQENPGLKIIARARDDRHAKRLYELGVTEAVPETFEASLQLGEAILVGAGVPVGHAIAAVHEMRDVHRKDLGRPDRRAQVASLRDSKRP